MADSYVCSGATMRCTMGEKTAKLTVLPSRTVFLCGKPMANISDHKSMVNLAPFGRCRSLGYPATAAATAAHHGHLTPMPCVHNTPVPWMNGKTDYTIKGQPALLKTCKLQCMWGGTISIIDDGQQGEGANNVQKRGKESFDKCIQGFRQLSIGMPQPSMDNQSDLILSESESKTIAIDDFKPLDVAKKHLFKLRALFLIKKPNKIFKDVPSAWKTSINNSINNINNKYKKEGIESVYSDVEHLFNMYKLATSDAAIEYGLDKLSDKTPYQVFDFEKKIPGFINNMPKKEFWDSFDKFVPLYTNVGTGAFFSPKYNYVAIPMTEKSIKRMADSDWYQAGRFYHEYGHAFDHMKGWRKDPDFTNLFEEFKEEMNNSDITKKLNEFIVKKGGISKLSKNELEKLMSLSDSLQAASPEHESIPPGGHSKAYYKSEDTQMAEFIAHMSENYWSGNDLYESLAPETYNKMHELIEKRWK